MMLKNAISPKDKSVAFCICWQCVMLTMYTYVLQYIRIYTKGRDGILDALLNKLQLYSK